jgi:hypothetical protein
MIWAFLFYPDARALLLGQFAVFVFAMVALGLWALDQQLDILAGCCLALSTVKPQVVFLLVILLLWWAALDRRWRFVCGFLGTMGLLLGASWLAEPAWLTGFVRQVAKYPSYTAIGSPIWILSNITFPVLETWGEWSLSLAALGYLLVAWRAALRKRTKGARDWAVGLCLIITSLVALRTATTNYVVLLLPLILTFRALQRKRWGPWLIVLIEVVLLGGLWVLFLTTVVDKFEHPAVYLPLPLGLLVVWALGCRWLTGGE